VNSGTFRVQTVIVVTTSCQIASQHTIQLVHSATDCSLFIKWLRHFNSFANYCLDSPESSLLTACSV